MNTARTPGSNLGALPAILVTTILQMVKYQYTKAQIRHQLATEYNEMKTISEAQITELAILLGKETDSPEWEWFNLLRSARDMSLFSNGTPAHTEPPSPPPSPLPPASLNTTVIIAGAAALVAVVLLTR